MTDPTPTQPPGSSTDSWLPTVALGLALAAFAAAGLTWQRMSTEVAGLRQSVRALTAEVAGMRQSAILDVEGAPARGAEDAIVTLVEFSDYECPFCLKHFQETAPRLDADYIQTGKIRYVFRDFPIDELHPEAIRAHEAAQCAREQGRFWEMHNILFTGPNSHSSEALHDRAREAGLAIDAFTSCLASGRTTDGIRASAATAAGFGANGTPAFFLGFRDPATNQVRLVRAISGAQSFEFFQQAIDALLAELN